MREDMKNSRRFVANSTLFLSILALVTACAPAGNDSGSTPAYVPQSGDVAIMFTHRFNAEDYDEGRSVLVSEISAAIAGSGQTRRTYFLHSADKSEFTAISFFHPDSSSEEWLAHDDREAVMAKLRPLYREPLEVQIFEVDDVHETN